MGCQIYWGDNGRLSIQVNSFNWKFPMPHRIVKMTYLRIRNVEEGKPYEQRPIWKDKSILILDQAGNSYNFEYGYRWDNGPMPLR